MRKEEMTLEEWEEFAKFARILHIAPKEKQEEVYYISEGAKMVAEKVSA